MKYKVGDKVRIKSLGWVNENKDVDGFVHCGDKVFDNYMSVFCGSVVTIGGVYPHIGYDIREDMHCRTWTDDMIEGLVEEETKFGTTSNHTEIKSNTNCITRERVDELATKIDKELPSGNPYEWECPEGYQFVDENGNVINATKIVLEKKKKSVIREEQIDNAAQEYIDSDNAVLTYSDGFCEQTDHPFVRAAFKAGVEWADNDVTQDDCSKAPKLTSQDYSNGRFGYQLPAGFKAKLTERELILTPEKPVYPKNLLDCENVLNGVRNDKKKLLHKFNELLICRDAYWKLYGEEMGLGKPWEPDYDSGVNKYGIICMNGVVQESNPTTNWERHLNKVLDFPTREMRDAFKENFDTDIEFCKEFL